MNAKNLSVSGSNPVFEDVSKVPTQSSCMVPSNH